MPLSVRRSDCIVWTPVPIDPRCAPLVAGRAVALAGGARVQPGCAGQNLTGHDATRAQLDRLHGPRLVRSPLAAMPGLARRQPFARGRGRSLVRAHQLRLPEPCRLRRASAPSTGRVLPRAAVHLGVIRCPHLTGGHGPTPACEFRAHVKGAGAGSKLRQSAPPRHAETSRTEPMRDPVSQLAQQIARTIADEIGAQPAQARAAIALLDEGATVPFIARYRKEVTGGLDDTQLRNLETRLTYLRELEDRRATVLASIDEQGKLSDELRAEIRSCRQQGATGRPVSALQAQAPHQGADRPRGRTGTARRRPAGRSEPDAGNLRRRLRRRRQGRGRHQGRARRRARDPDGALGRGRRAGRRVATLVA